MSACVQCVIQEECPRFRILSPETRVPSSFSVVTFQHVSCIKISHPTSPQLPVSCTELGSWEIQGKRRHLVSGGLLFHVIGEPGISRWGSKEASWKRSYFRWVLEEKGSRFGGKCIPDRGKSVRKSPDHRKQKQCKPKESRGKIIKIRKSGAKVLLKRKWLRISPHWIKTGVNRLKYSDKHSIKSV